MPSERHKVEFARLFTRACTILLSADPITRERENLIEQVQMLLACILNYIEQP